jgi:hypothetical protein
MLQQKRDDRLLVGVVSGIQAKLLEALVLADQVGNRTVEHVDDFLEPLARRMIFQVFDGVELDTARPKYLERAFRVASARIVKKGYPFHRFLVWIFGEHKRCSGFDGNALSGYNFTGAKPIAMESS